MLLTEYDLFKVKFCCWSNIHEFYFSSRASHRLGRSGEAGERGELARVLVSVSGEKGINNKARFIIVVILSA